MKEFKISKDGRTSNLFLLFGVICIEVFAIWSFVNLVRDGFSWIEVIPALILLVMALAAPFLVWNILEEINAKIIIDDNNIRFSSIGIELSSPWSELTLRIEEKDKKTATDDEEVVKLRLKQDSISNSILRFLHWQANGRDIIPIYSSLENQTELINLIKEKIVQKKNIIQQ